MIREIVIIHVEELLGPRPNTSRRAAPCRPFATVFSSYIENKAPNCRPFLHSQPKDAPCCGDVQTDPLSVTDII